MSLELEDFVVDALDTVLDWDLPDEACAEAVLTQASLLAGVETDDIS